MKILSLPNKDIVSLPTEIDELNLGQFLALRKAGATDALTIVSILSKRPIETLQTMNFDRRTEYQMSVMCNEITAEIVRYFSAANEAQRRRQITDVKLGDKVIKVPDDLNKYAYWSTRRAAVIIEQELQSIQNGGAFDATDSYAELLAHYLYCPYTEMKYDERRADDFIEVVNELPITVAIPLGNFIMLGQKKSWQPSKINSVIKLLTTSAKLTRQALQYLGRLLR